MARKPKKRDGLENPYPSSPGRPAKYVIYYYPIDRDGSKRIGAQTWCTLYAAKRLVDTLIDGREVTWINSSEMTVGRMLIRCEDLEDIMEYEYANDEEEQWELSPAEKLSALSAAGKAPERDEQQIAKATAKAVRSVPRGERKPRASREGLVSVQDIATELGVKPRDARAVLRRLKISKPDAGWAWPKAEATKMAAQLKKELKR